MKSSYRVPYLRFLVLSLFASTGVLSTSLVVQWLVYDDWLHRTGPLRIIGTSIAALITFAFVFRGQHLAYVRQQEMIRRFEVISTMNDKIRNALQIIVCMSFVHDPKLTQQVQQALDAIDQELRGVLKEVSSPVAAGTAAKSVHTFPKSA